MSTPPPTELLRAYSRAALESIARRRRLDVRGRNKEGILELLAAEMFDTRSIEQALAALGPVERRVLEEVQLLGGDAPTGLVRRQLVKAGLVADIGRGYPAGRARRYGDRPTVLDFGRLVGELTARGLLYSTAPNAWSGTHNLDSPGRRLVIPDDVLERLPPLSLPVATVDGPVEARQLARDTLLHDAYAFVSLGHRGVLQLTSRGLLTRRALIALLDEFHGAEELPAGAGENQLHRLPLLRGLLEDLGVLLEREGALVASERASDFIGKPRGQRQADLVDAYLTSRRWSEPFHIPKLRIEPVSAWRSAPGRVVTARQRVLDELSKLPVACWIAVDHLVERLERTAYELLFQRDLEAFGSSTYSHYGNPYADNPLGWEFTPYLTEAEGWGVVEAGLIRVVVGALAWLGVLELGTSSAVGEVFRLSEASARLLHGQAPSDEPRESHVVVQPNFQVFALEPTDESILFGLDRIAERSRSERVTEYRLTREATYRAQNNGLSTQDIVGFLENVSSVPLPQNVRRSLEEWGALHQRVTLRPRAGLLQAVSEEALDSLYADPDLVPLLGRRIGPTAAFVPHQHLALLNDRLCALGRVAALSEGKPPWPASGLVLRDDGTLDLLGRAPDLMLLRDLAHIAEIDAGGHWRLSQVSLRRATESGLDAEGITRLIEGWQGEPLVPEAASLIRRWSLPGGRASLQQVMLLQVESQDVLAEMLADSALAGCLVPIAGSATSAIAAASGVRKVRHWLVERGVELADSDSAASTGTG